MPTVPVIQQLGPSQRVRPFKRPDTSGAMRGTRILVQGVQEFGAALGAEYQKIQDERNVADAHSAVQKFGDQARQRYVAFKSLEGASATGATEAYQKWYDDEARKISLSLPGGQSRAIFTDSAARRRNSDLNSLAGHEGQQHRVYLQSNLDGAVSNAMQDAAVYSDDPKRIEELSQNISSMRNGIKPGLDNTEQNGRDDFSLKAAAITSQMQKDPFVARKLFDRWKTSLGPAGVKIKDDVDREVLVSQARIEHPGNFDAQYDYIADLKGVKGTVKRAVLGQINSAQAEERSRDAQAMKDRRKEGFDSYFESIISGDMNGARKKAESWDNLDFDESERYQALQRTERQESTTDHDAYRSLYMSVLRGGIKTSEQLLKNTLSDDLNNADLRVMVGEIERRNKGENTTKDSYINHGVSLLKGSLKSEIDTDEIAVAMPEIEQIFIDDVQTAEADKGRGLTRDEMTQLVKSLLEVETEKRSFLGIDVLRPDLERTTIERRLSGDSVGAASTPPKSNVDPLGILQ